MHGILSDSHHRLLRRATRVTFASAAIVLAFGLGGCGSSSDDESSAATSAPASAATSKVPPDGVALLGVLNAEGGTFADGKLTLTDVDPRGVWFTDRPARRAGTEGIDAFTKRFFAGDDPPNAAVKVAGAPASKDLAVVELSEPAYDAKARTLSFAANVVPDGESKSARAARIARHPGLAEALADQDGAVPAKFGAATVFIDDAPAAPVNQELQALVAEDAKLESIYTNAVNVTRIAIDEDGESACLMQFFNRMLEVQQSVVADVPYDLAQLQADAAKNGGKVPSSDQGMLSSVQDQLEGASETAVLLPAELARVQRGQCPYG